MRASPSGLRSPFKVSANQGPATTCAQSGSVPPDAPSAPTAAPATMRMASPKLMPFWAAVRSTAPKCSIIPPSRSWSTSTQRPRTSARPSDLASNSLISSAVKVSPSSVTSMRKSRSASLPKPDGVLPPTLPVTCGRGGRFDRQFAGIRTTTPALSNWGTSLRSCKALLGCQRNGWKISPASTMAFSHGQLSAARCTGRSRDNRRPLLAAPAYSRIAWPRGRCCALAWAERRVV